MYKYIVTTMALMFMVTTAYAETTWQVAPGRSSVNFKVKHLLFSHVDGRFKKFEGSMVTPSEDLSGAQLEATIHTGSIYTGNQDRDKHLNSVEFFSSDIFPKITFKSKKFVRTDAETYKILGELTIRGVTKPVVLTAKYEGQKTLKNGKQRLDFVAAGEVNRFDYDLKWNEFMESGGGAIVGDMVEIELDIALFKVVEDSPKHTEVAIENIQVNDQNI